MNARHWFDVDRRGLAKLLERRGKGFAVCELVQNAWDTSAGDVAVRLTPEPGTRRVLVEVEDDAPEGFADLAHSFTLFAESIRKADPAKRGRFNLGEKLVLALCKEARIESTTGTVRFDEGGRWRSSVKRERGSRFAGVISMTAAEVAEALALLRTLIPPAGVRTTINGEPLVSRPPLASTTAALRTEAADAEGVLRRVTRQARVVIHEVLPGEKASIYELGIPVVETGDRWHVNVHQKVPLGFDRDNVTPEYLRALRVVVLNLMSSEIQKEDANATWVRDAGSSPDARPEAMHRIVDLRFGEKRVIYDPSDKEANSIAVSRGYTVMHGGMLNAGEWENVRRSSAALPAGAVTPSPKPFSLDGAPLKLLPAGEWSRGLIDFAECAKEAALAILGLEIEVECADDPAWGFNAAFGKSRLTINVSRADRRAMFETWPNEKAVALLIHEFAHHYESDHLSERYHAALCTVGARFTELATRHEASFRCRGPR